MWIVHLGQTLEELLKALRGIEESLKIISEWNDHEELPIPEQKEQVRMGRRQSWPSKRAKLEAEKTREVNESIITANTD